MGGAHMNDFDVMERIKELCRMRSWTYYRLAKESGIPYSTLNTMLHKTYVPTIPSLMKICDGLGITLAQFFSVESEQAKLSKKENECLKQWRKLDDQSKAMAMAYMEGLEARQKKD